MSTILMVDDDAAQLTLLRLGLRHTPYRLLTAQSAAEALRLVHEQWPDLMLIDIAMPTMNGLQLLEVLRAEPQGARLKVIFMTAGQQPIASEEAASAHRVLTKPFSFEALIEAIQAALSAEV
jgi:CheY-like chemotaxis protein